MSITRVGTRHVRWAVRVYDRAAKKTRHIGTFDSLSEAKNAEHAAKNPEDRGDEWDEDRDYESLHAISRVLQRRAYGDGTDAESALQAIQKIITEAQV